MILLVKITLSHGLQCDIAGIAFIRIHMELDTNRLVSVRKSSRFRFNEWDMIVYTSKLVHTYKAVPYRDRLKFDVCRVYNLYIMAYTMTADEEGVIKLSVSWSPIPRSRRPV